MLNYFSSELEEKKDLIIHRENHKELQESLIKMKRFYVGDIVRIHYRVKNIIYTFEGLCIKLSKKNFNNINLSVILRNILWGVGMELTFLHFTTRTFSFAIQDYKRKKFIYKHSKLYYLRQKLNRETRVNI